MIILYIYIYTFVWNAFIRLTFQFVNIQKDKKGTELSYARAYMYAYMYVLHAIVRCAIMNECYNEQLL